jgi:hypothetical protein
MSESIRETRPPRSGWHHECLVAWSFCGRGMTMPPGRAGASSAPPDLLARPDTYTILSFPQALDCPHGDTIGHAEKLDHSVVVTATTHVKTAKSGSAAAPQLIVDENAGRDVAFANPPLDSVQLDRA